MTASLARRAVIAASLALSAPAAAQSLRSLGVSRALVDSAALQVRVTYGAGHLDIRRDTAPTPTLYSMRLRYDAGSSTPVYAYNQGTRSLRVGLEKLSGNFPGARPQAGDLQLGLTRAAPLDLSLELGAVQADVNLTGLRVERLKLESGASDATVRFDAPNAEPMRLLELQSGVANIHAMRLANANAEEVRVKAGVGSLELDFGGEWRRNAELTLDVALGSVILRVPSDVGLRVELAKRLASFDAPGLRHQGGAVWVSENWSTAAHRLLVRGHATLGKVTVERP